MQIKNRFRHPHMVKKLVYAVFHLRRYPHGSCEVIRSRSGAHLLYLVKWKTGTLTGNPVPYKPYGLKLYDAEFKPLTALELFQLSTEISICLGHTYRKLFFRIFLWSYEQ